MKMLEVCVLVCISTVYIFEIWTTADQALRCQILALIKKWMKDLFLASIDFGSAKPFGYKNSAAWTLMLQEGIPGYNTSMCKYDRQVPLSTV